MAITTIRTDSYGALSIADYQGLSTDTKPTSCAYGSTFLEVDTGKIWIYDANTNSATSDGWWEI